MKSVKPALSDQQKTQLRLSRHSGRFGESSHMFQNFRFDLLDNSSTIVLSIKPRFSTRILEGSKTVELRRRFPMNLPNGTMAIIYATTPEQALVGIVEIESVVRMNVIEIWQNHVADACIDREEFDAYFIGQDHGFVLKLNNARPLTRWVHLSYLRDQIGFRAPQSFCYVNHSLRSVLRNILS